MRKNYWVQIYVLFLFYIAFSSQIFISSSGYSNSLNENSSNHVLIVPMVDYTLENELNFNFTVQERISRQDSWYHNQQSASIEIPENYSRVLSEFVVQVRNESIYKPETNTNISTYLPNNQRYAQMVYIPEEMDLTGISLYLTKKNNPTDFIFELRSENLTGKLIFRQLYAFSGNYEGWYDFQLNDYVHLPNNNLIFIIEAQSGQNYKKLFRSPSGENVSKTWYYDGTWNIADYDIPLKLNVTKFVSPESVDLRIDNIPVVSVGNNLGKAFIEKIVFENLVNLTFNSNASVNISYSVNSTFIDEKSLSYKIIQEGNFFKWNLTINPQNHSYPYTDYQIYIEGLKSDYSNFAAWNDNYIVDFQILANNIVFSNFPITMFSFTSINYLETINIPDYSANGDEIQINATSRAVGNISLNIYADSSQNTPIFQDNRSFQNRVSFLFTIPISNSSEYLEIELIYFGNNEFGYLKVPLSVFQKMEILSTDYRVKTFEMLNIICQTRDYYNHNAVTECKVHLHLENLDIPMNHTENGFYKVSLDLNQLNLPAGAYNAIINVQDEYFISNQSEIVINVEKRDATIRIIKERSTIHPGKSINWKIQLFDNETQKFLLRTVKINTQVTAMDGHNQSGVLDYQSIEEVSQEVDLTLDIPKTAEPGAYQLQVEIISEYYSGIKVFPEIVQVVKPIGWYVYISISLGLVGGASMLLYYYQEKVRRSLFGVLILHSNGLPLAYKLSGNLLENDAVLISAALTGVISIMKEITGSTTRIIQIEGGYIIITKMEDYWVILFTAKSPIIIRPIILKFIKDLDQNYVPREKMKHPRPFYVDFDSLCHQYFHCTIDLREESNSNSITDSDKQKE
ncbi:MAG: COG1470 family protein [Promethearchaeota archaeon]